MADTLAQARRLRALRLSVFDIPYQRHSRQLSLFDCAHCAYGR